LGIAGILLGNGYWRAGRRVTRGGGGETGRRSPRQYRLPARVGRDLLERSRDLLEALRAVTSKAQVLVATPISRRAASTSTAILATSTAIW
jgi:hypothetical protein